MIWAIVWSGWAYAHGADGHVVVVNDAGAPMQVDLVGQGATTLPAGGTAVFDAHPGEGVVRASYVQFGREQVLEATHVAVRPHQSVTVRLEPEDHGRIKVRNDTTRSGTLRLDGRDLLTLAPGQSEIVEVPLGRFAFSLTDSQGRTLDREEVQVRAYAEPVWTAEAPRFGEITVSNPNGIPVTALIGGRPVAEIAAFGSATGQAPVGAQLISLVDARGRLVDEILVEIDPWEDAFIEVQGRLAMSARDHHQRPR